MRPNLNQLFTDTRTNSSNLLVSHRHKHTHTHRLELEGSSHGDRSVRVFGSAVDDVLDLSRVGHVVARLVLGQDLHQRTQLQPPLLFGDPVTDDKDTEI